MITQPAADNAADPANSMGSLEKIASLRRWRSGCSAGFCRSS
jgi:hypothetical protein